MLVVSQRRARYTTLVATRRSSIATTFMRA
jgi:hypothetical protein